MEKRLEVLEDKFGRIHNYLRLSLTELCNHRCFYCMPEEGVPLKPADHYMTSDEVFSIANTFVKLGVNKIRLTGGEPLLRKDFAEIVTQLATLNANIGITTNGVLLDKHLDLLEKLAIKNINVSLDSLKREKQFLISRKDYFERIIKNIESLVARDFNIKINMVVMNKVNHLEVLDFIKWTEFLPIKVRFIEYMPFNGNNWNWKKGIPEKELLKLTSQKFGKQNILRIKDEPNDTAKNYKIANHLGSFAFISSVSNPFCGTCNRVRITADGKMKNCLFSKSETDLLTPLRNGMDLKPLIKSSVWDKKSVRAGMSTLKEFSAPSEHKKNRSMISIGG